MPKIGPVAVIDVETTGKFPARNDRVVEIAAVVVCGDGNIEREFSSLVNPGRDIGPMHIHGLTSEDIMGAPRFDEIAATLIETLSGCVAIAAHNVHFDRQFMETEFEKFGQIFPDCHSICTLAFTRQKLEDACCTCGVPFDGEAHQALGDARAAAGLLAWYWRNNPHRIDELAGLDPIQWPVLPPSKKKRLGRHDARQRQKETPTYLQRLLGLTNGHLSDSLTEEAEISYSELLDRVLEDRRVEESEGEALLQTANKWGLNGHKIAHLHRNYLNQLADAALADGIVTESELRDLTLVARLLGLEPLSKDDILARAGTKFDGAKTQSSPPVRAQTAGNKDFVGKSVCFTGELLCCLGGERLSRERAHELAANAGLEIANSVTKSLDILVVADPHTQSGKAKKARQYGARIMHEPVFWKAIGVGVE